MLEMLITTLQWSLIVGIWAFTAIGFYRSYQEIRRVFRPIQKRARVSHFRQAPEQSESDNWLMAA